MMNESTKRTTVRPPPEIIQITGVQPGWWACFEDEKEGVTWSEPIICWGLVREPDGTKHVVGITDTPESATGRLEGSRHFIGYSPKSRGEVPLFSDSGSPTTLDRLYAEEQLRRQTVEGGAP